VVGIAIDKKRNIAIIGQGDAGKTTLSEAILFSAEATPRIGRVDDGSSILDYEPEEQKRNITLSASLHHYEWDKHLVNIIDTPGYSNFLTETRNALRVADGAVIVLSAVSGVKVQTERVWGFADELDVSRIAFVNELDRERANFLTTVDDMERSLEVKGVPIHIPLDRGPGFNGVVDLLSMKLFLYKEDLSGNYDVKDVPAELKEKADKMREEMVEAIVETDDAMMEKYLEGGEVTVEELKEGLRKGVITKKFMPVLCGSAYNNMGINLLMDMINLCLPSPLDRPAMTGTDPKSGEEASRGPGDEEPFSALVFKTIIDPFTGKLSFFRVYSGKITGESAVFNPQRTVKGKIGHLFLLEGKKTKEVNEASAGDIVAVAKLKNTYTGDSLCDAGAPIQFAPFPPVSTTLSYAITPKTKTDEDKVPQAMARLIEEDPSLEFRRDAETKEFILSGVGQVHLEADIEKLKRKYGCEVELKTPRIPYKETIRSTAKVQGKYKKQSGGRGQYGDTWLEISPLSKGEGFEFINNIVGGVIPRQYIPAVEKGVKEAMKGGVLAGYPVVDLKVRLYDGSHHSVDSSEMAFKIAASMGFKKAVEQAQPVLLEPIMSMEILVPDENMGDVIGDLNSRRGKIQGVEPKRGNQNIKAIVPMAEVINYASVLNGITRDRGVFTMEFSHYEEIPNHLSQKIITKSKAEKEKK
jgi:elongation factor G